MPITPDAHLTVRALVPPGNSLVGVYPLELFRVERICSVAQPGLSFVRGGKLVPCDGFTHLIQHHERTLCMGSFLALHVHSEHKTPMPFEVTLRGLSLDRAKVDAQLVQGLFVMEADHPPAAITSAPVTSVPSAADSEDYGDYSEATGDEETHS